MQNAKQIAKGCYPTMITPYRDGEIDYAAVDRLVDWYLENDCDGIFAVCQSSEMAFLSLRERLQLAERVVRRVDGRISVVVGGHVSNSILDQAEEVNALAQVGADAVVLVTNRFDIANDGDDAWIANGEKLLSLIKDDVRLGLYECPVPYKRLLTEKTLEWCINTGRFGFIKDTCCDPVLLQQRIQRLEGTGLLLYNANQQTLLESLRCGGAGYCGIMANFVPKAISWVCHNFDKSDKAEFVANVLSMMAFTEGVPYPVTAKCFLNDIGVSMEPDARSARKNLMTPYLELMVKQMRQLDIELQKIIAE